ncbi:MAG: glycosyltransferase family 2 protein [Prevotella sp.]
MEQTGIQIHYKETAMIEVSILVAVYNASRFIEKCLHSLLDQTLREIQVICIDDNSTDNSLEILRRFAGQDNRIDVIHLDSNSGAAHARNEGLKIAQGRYITFVDSDDWIATDALQQAVDVFKSKPTMDCVLFDAIMVDAVSGKEEPYPMTFFDDMTGKQAFKESLSWHIHGLYLVRSDIHKKYPYDESCHSYSDDNTTRLHYLNSRHVGCCRGRYYYLQHAASQTHAISMNKFEHMRANRNMRKMMIELNIDSKLIDEYENTRWIVLVDTYMFYFIHRRELTKAQRRFALSEMKHIWGDIDTSKLKYSLRCKFGYLPLRLNWSMFRLQEEIYFLLKRIFGR